jgi:hypothetical protein
MISNNGISIGTPYPLIEFRQSYCPKVISKTQLLCILEWAIDELDKSLHGYLCFLLRDQYHFNLYLLITKLLFECWPEHLEVLASDMHNPSEGIHCIHTIVNGLDEDGEPKDYTFNSSQPYRRQFVEWLRNVNQEKEFILLDKHDFKKANPHLWGLE